MWNHHRQTVGAHHVSRVYLPNLQKCDFVPSQFFDFVGIHYLLPLSRVSPTSARRTSIGNKVSSFLHHETRSIKQFQSLIGSLNSTFLLVEPMGRMHIRPLQWQLARARSSSEGRPSKHQDTCPSFGTLSFKMVGMHPELVARDMPPRT